MRLFLKSATRRIWVLAAVLTLASGSAAQQGPWDQPAADLAHRIADVLGPATAHLTWTNLSSIPPEAVLPIRRAVEHFLATDGVNPAASDSPNLVRVTLSQDARGGLWVAEIQQGNETRVVMARADLRPSPQTAQGQKIALQRRTLARSSELPWKADARDSSIPQILAAIERTGELIVLTTSRIAVFDGSPAGWTPNQSADLPITRSASRDPRGVIIATPDGFSASAPGLACSGTQAAAAGQAPQWTLHCQPSDDPWPIAQTTPNTVLRAFYNAGRDYFTGIITPEAGADLPAFYTAALLPGRAQGPALLLDGVDGKVLLLEGTALNPVAGTRDWGSDFAALSSGCGAGAQVLVSSSGEGASDSLRAYEITGQEAQPASEPLAVEGTAMAVAPAADGKSAVAIVRNPLAGGQTFDYEVDRVTAVCD